MNKIESRHRLIRSLIMEKKVHTQQELQERLIGNHRAGAVPEESYWTIEDFWGLAQNASRQDRGAL